NATPTTQEVDMVAIFAGEHVRSSANPFYGGKILTMFGGTRLDLRDVTPAPTGIYIDLAMIFGGLDLVIPEGWKVDFTGTVLAGGFDDMTATDANSEATTVHIGGIMIMSGARVANISIEEAASV
ncbi:MAG: hypothetical protein KDB69_07800, partial [Acidimicrobiia bacterium]|nr:hypothetical protein [Acidimicrobiia bacterium]